MLACRTYCSLKHTQLYAGLESLLCRCTNRLIIVLQWCWRCWWLLVWRWPTNAHCAWDNVAESQWWRMCAVLGHCSHDETVCWTQLVSKSWHLQCESSASLCIIFYSFSLQTKNPSFPQILSTTNPAPLIGLPSRTHDCSMGFCFSFFPLSF